MTKSKTLTALLAISICGCGQVGGRRSETIISSPSASVKARNPSTQDSPANKRSKRWWDELTRARKLAKGDIVSSKEAETVFNRLLQEEPRINKPLIELGHIYSSRGDASRATLYYLKFLEKEEAKHTTSISPLEWYTMYLTFNKANRPADARFALKSAIHDQKVDSSINYVNTSRIPSNVAVRLAEYMAAAWAMSGATDLSEAQEKMVALSRKDHLSPKLMLAIANKLTIGRRRDSIAILKRLVQTKGPEAERARERLIAYGELPGNRLTR